MKLKAVFDTKAPDALIAEANKLRGTVMEKVLKQYLSVVGFGPAEFYVQESDLAQSLEHFCEVRLSGISLNDDRAPNHFRKACAELVKIYTRLIKMHLPKKQKMQLFVVIMLDQPLPNGSTLVENDPQWIEGECLPTQ